MAGVQTSEEVELEWVVVELIMVKSWSAAKQGEMLKEVRINFRDQSDLGEVIR